MTKFIPAFQAPILEIKNISQQKVDIFGVVNIMPGEIKEIFSSILPENRDDYLSRAIRELSPPNGQLYLHSINRIIEILDFKNGGSNVDETQIRTVNSYFSGAVLSFNGTGLQWVAPGAANAPVLEPLVNNGSNIYIPKASALADGYLSKDDYSYIFQSLRKRKKIWQYQDFSAPVGSAIELTAFQNGTGLTFDSSYIINDTAAIVQQADLNAPPTTTISFPGRYFPGNRVQVTSHIYETIILNAAPAADMPCRIYFMISLPDGVLQPYDYQEAPAFLKNAPSSNLDNSYLNSNEDEDVYGEKTYKSLINLEGSFKFEQGAVDGYVMYADSNGIGYWGPPPEGTGGGSGTLRNISILSTGNSPGNLTLSSVDWNVQNSYIRTINIQTASTKFDIWICETSDFDISSVRSRRVVYSGNQNMLVDVNANISSVSTNLYIVYVDHTGSNLANFYIAGEERTS